MGSAASSERDYRVRECAHRPGGARGDYYEGASYVESLGRLRASAAAEFARRVTSFYWADAAKIIVWLCDDCAAELQSLRRTG